MYHVMTFIEMTQAVSGMVVTKADRQIDEIFRVQANRRDF